MRDWYDVMGMLRAQYHNRMLMNLEETASQGLEPMTAHPHYEHRARSIRQAMDSGTDRMVLPNMSSHIAALHTEANTPEPEQLHTTTLNVRRRWAPAPWTGRNTCTCGRWPSMTTAGESVGKLSEH